MATLVTDSRLFTAAANLADTGDVVWLEADDPRLAGLDGAQHSGRLYDIGGGHYIYFPRGHWREPATYALIEADALGSGRSMTYLVRIFEISKNEPPFRVVLSKRVTLTYHQRVHLQELAAQVFGVDKPTHRLSIVRIDNAEEWAPTQISSYLDGMRSLAATPDPEDQK